jgi:hypothetical protein
MRTSISCVRWVAMNAMTACGPIMDSKSPVTASPELLHLKGDVLEYQAAFHFEHNRFAGLETGQRAA